MCPGRRLPDAKGPTLWRVIGRPLESLRGTSSTAPVRFWNHLDMTTASPSRVRESGRVAVGEALRIGRDSTTSSGNPLASARLSHGRVKQKSGSGTLQNCTTRLHLWSAQVSRRAKAWPNRHVSAGRTDGGCVLVPSQEPRYKRRDCQAIAWERWCDHFGMSQRDACSTWLLVG